MPHRVPLYGGSCARNQKTNLNRILKLNINHYINSTLQVPSHDIMFPERHTPKSDKIWIIEQFRNACNYLPLLNTLKARVGPWLYTPNGMCTGYSKPSHHILPACLPQDVSQWRVQTQSVCWKSLFEKQNTAGRCRARALGKDRKKPVRKKWPGNRGSLFTQCPMQLKN